MPDLKKEEIEELKKTFNDFLENTEEFSKEERASIGSGYSKVDIYENPKMSFIIYVGKELTEQQQAKLAEFQYQDVPVQIDSWNIEAFDEHPPAPKPPSP